MAKEIGNEAQMAEVAKAMELARQAQQGGNLKEGTYIDFESLDGNKYTGWIVFKKPSMADFMRAGALKSEFFRRAGVKDTSLVDDSIGFMAHVMSMLEVVIDKRPEWLLKISEVTEPELLYHVFGKFNEWEGSFRKDFRGSPAPDSEGSEGTKAVDS